MKALVYETAHPLENFAIRLADVPEPALRDLDLLVEVRAVGINPGEAFIRTTRSAEAGGHVLLGFEFAGVVAEMGAGVKGFEVGDRVFGTGDMSRDGAWAERVAVDHRVVARLPEGLSFVEAASLPVGALTAWEALFREQEALPAGVDRVLVVGGAGAVGSLATQLLKAKTKASVISTASRPESRQWCQAMGADFVVDHSKRVEDELAAIGMQNVDLVLSTANVAGNLDWIARVLRPFGHLSVVDLSPGLDVSALMMKSVSLHFEMVFSKILHGSGVESQGRALVSVAAMVKKGEFRPIATTPLEGLTVETMKAAHALVESKRTIGKVVVATLA